MLNAEKILKESHENYNITLEERRTLHENAETGFDLTNTVSYVKSELEKICLKPVLCGKAGLYALVGGNKDGDTGKVFLLRADMDALPMAEQSGVEFAAKNGNMHACGHDMHTAMLLGAARLLKKHESELKGTVKLMFQSAEEIFEGASDMIKNGILENPTVDAAMMIHVMSAMPMQAGTVIVSAAGVSAPAADYFEISIKGKGCHGSMPNTGIDPINAAAHVITALQEINSRELALGERAAITIGTVNGGTATNIIPDSVTLGGSIRTFDEDTRTYVKNRLTEISEYTAKAFRANAEVTFGSGCPPLTNDEKLSECAEKYVCELLGSERTVSAAKLAQSGGRSSQSAGSEDFAYVSREVPSIMLALAAGNPEDGYSYPQHHPMVKFDENVLSAGSAVYAYVAMRWLEENS